MSVSYKKQHPLKGVIFFMTAIFLISVVDTVCKVFTKDLHSIQLVWGYFVGINLTLWVFFLFKGEKFSNLRRTERPLLQIIRPAFLVCSISSLFIGLTYLPIAEATVIGFVAPLFITALSVPILKEHVDIHRWSAVAIGLVGVIIIIRPGGDLWHLASVMPLLGALFFALFQIITRLLAATERTHTTLFYTGLGGLAWSSLIVPFVWVTPSITHIFVFLSTGAMGAMAHLCMISAFDRAEASLLAPYNYTKLIWVSVLGYLIFNDVPSLDMWIGAIIIVSAGFYVLYREKNINLKM
ncbi:MAG: DMT family transporter [Pseudomonadota bacterium]|jgi:drug/metabolite transporter (DMT)-like permease|nr:DMT family transporter [Pseudomonadota bacterium]|tara:strand:- start:1 stop:888 length:888 start_codon:yes stop_codon:yes gene_type:complete